MFYYIPYRGGIVYEGSRIPRKIKKELKRHRGWVGKRVPYYPDIHSPFPQYSILKFKIQWISDYYIARIPTNYEHIDISLTIARKKPYYFKVSLKRKPSPRFILLDNSI